MQPPTRVALAALWTALLALPAGFLVVPAEAREGDDRLPCPGFVVVKGQGPSCPRPDGLWEVLLGDGRSVLTHGPDRFPPEPDLGGSGGSGSAPPVCVADPATEHHIRVIYARPFDLADRYGDLVDDIRQTVKDVNQKLRDELREFDLAADYRVVCSGGQVSVANARLPTGRNDDDFHTIVRDLNNLGYTDSHAKYWIYYDDTVDCGGCAGEGSFLGDDELALDNDNLLSSGHAISYRDLGVRVWMHENGHNLGAVADSSPNSSLAGHCNDGQDIMCYEDEGPPLYNPFYCLPDKRFDCNHNDYFNPHPNNDNYLFAQWNLASPYNRYIEFQNHCGIPDDPLVLRNGVERGVTPINSGMNSCYFTVDVPAGMTRLRVEELADNLDADRDLYVRAADLPLHSSDNRLFDCHDTNVDASASCEVNPPLPGLYFVEVHNWDGTRDPFRVKASYSRNCGTAAAPVALANGVEIRGNPPGGGFVNCMFTIQVPAGQARLRIEETSPGGDDRDIFVRRGGPPNGGGDCADQTANSAAVCELVNPAAGTYWIEVVNVASNTNEFTLRATFNAAAANQRPVMQTAACSPDPSRIGETVTCAIRGTDDSAGVFYSVAWGDGATTRVPAAGTVAPGAQQSTGHAYAVGGTYTIRVTATDNAAAPLTSVELNDLQRVNRAPGLPTLSCAPAAIAPGDATTCTATATDPDGNDLSYSFTWGDGAAATRVPAAGLVASGTEGRSTHTFANAGSYAVSAAATDANGLAGATRTFTVTVNIQNAAPNRPTISCTPDVVEAGQETTCEVRATDPDANALHYTVRWGDGASTRLPDAGTVASGTALQASHAYAVLGDYPVTAFATDTHGAEGATATQTVTVAVLNHAPDAPTVSCSPSTITPGQSTRCEATATDPDGDPIFYSFVWGDGAPDARVPREGTVASGATRDDVHPFAAAGAYTVAATATDDEGATGAPGTAVVTVEANSGPHAPELSCTPQQAQPGKAVTCTADATDPEHDAVSYEFAWGDGTSTRAPATGALQEGTPQRASHVYAAAGPFVVTVRGIDSHGAAGFARTLPVTVTATNQAPVVRELACTPNPGAIGQLVACTARATDDSGGVAYVFDWGDGSTTRLPPSGVVTPDQPQTATHVYSSAATFGVRVTATDNDPAPATSAPATLLEAVRVAPPNRPPAIEALWCTPDVSDLRELVTCHVRASDDSTGIAFLVDWGDGTPPTRVPAAGTVAPGATETAAHEWFLDRSFVVTVTATDDAGAPLTSDPRVATQTVQPGGACPLHRSGFLPTGLQGADVEGVSARWENAIPLGCRLRAFTLRGDLPTDVFDLCWVNALGVRLLCQGSSSFAEGKIPAGATRARVVYVSGAGGTYHLDAA